MKPGPKEPFVPPERHETIRQEIMEILEAQNLSAREISGSVGVSVREVYEHLDHIQKTAGKRVYHLVVTPATCRRCGFAFAKRAKLKKPGKCPVCRGESIDDPLFSIRKTGERP